MQKFCRQCSAPFVVSELDQRMLQKLSPIMGKKSFPLPTPNLCPNCRQQRRAAFRNEWFYHHRKCDLSGKQMISIYSSDSPFPVYEKDEWWSDKWDPLQYGMSYDRQRSFLAQFYELFQSVPRQNLYGKNNENCQYTNHVERSKNCYLCVDTIAEDVLYSKYVFDGSKDCVDCYMLQHSELCYEAQYTQGYRCFFTFSVEQCSDSAFLYNCIGCKNCFMCWNLRNKQYCIKNQQYTKEEYFRILQEFDLGSYQNLQRYHSRFQDLLEAAPRRATTQVNCEDSTGDFLRNCKSVRNSFDLSDSRDCGYCYDCAHLNDCWDTYESAFECELQYEGYACNRGKRLISCSVCYDVSDIYYSDTCHNSQNLMGCVGLRNKRYCILNKQYSKEAYEKLLPLIIEDMIKRGEWGKFFPIGFSPFPYNETVAQEFHPLNAQEAQQRGWAWSEKTSKRGYQGPEVFLPDHIRDVPDDICEQVLICKETGDPYKITPQELQFHRRMNIALPRLSPHQRHLNRMTARNPKQLWKRICSDCDTDVMSSYPPEQKISVYCDDCFLTHLS